MASSRWSGGSKGRFTVEFVFNNELASVGSVTTSCGTVQKHDSTAAILIVSS